MKNRGSGTLVVLVLVLCALSLAQTGRIRALNRALSGPAGGRGESVAVVLPPDRGGISAPDAAEKPAGSAGDAGDEAADTVATLESLVADRERDIAALQAELDQLKQREQRPPRDRGGRRRGPAMFDREAMAKLREEDPEAYAAMVKRRDAMRQQMTAALQSQGDFFARIRVEELTEEQLADHQRLMELVAEAEALMAEVQAAPEGEDVDPLRRQIRENMHESFGLWETEREIALRDLAKGLGYPEEQVPEFVDYVDYVYDMTSPTTFFRGMRAAMRGDSGGGQRAAGEQPGGER